MKLLYFFALALTASAAPICQTKTVNLTATAPFALPPTLLPPLSQCSYMFNVPSGFYAVLSFSASDMAPFEYVASGDRFGDSYNFYGTPCNSSCQPQGTVSYWPSNFEVSTSTSAGTKMRLQMSVSLKPFDLSTSAGTITVANNTPSSVVYFKDWKQGTTYTITSNTKSVYLNAAIPFLPYDLGLPYNNVFVFDGGKNVGTLYHASEYGYNSNSNTIQLYLANAMNFPGAFLATDYSNVSPCLMYLVNYVPLTEGHAFVGLEGFKNNGDGCETIIGEKDGSTPLTIYRVDDFDDGSSVFSYTWGGPLSSHQTKASPLNASMIPKTLNATVNTFYASPGEGNIFFSVPKIQ